jgi:6-phosphogluconolactonase
VERITLTPPLINASAEVHFLVVGPAKAAIVRGVLEGPRRANDLPAQLVAPVAGEVRWFLDTAAAAHLAGHGRD